ncbi:rop guanine nucleotide exchange factor 9-like [Dioscorea cayenensis subsp. rotundata]|uniref:Rop guanine nucleotide exchange factor 9-like n=1 Tax=Dioscorea cayennensis subsp. rotundata TaxID=55577 RepID=A0AB40BFD6_DIOCR|nr:rop guanine nucleotide exchange factor 9-like [Dioscorea cayenensis subsp. rotundata]
MELMKERFAKLLLGEDMSGGGKGVSSALALSNAITNLAASVFGEQWRLEPMSVERKTRWRKEIDWLLSVTDNIVEFVPSQQTSKDGTNMEIMVTQQRKDLHMNIPALRKLDAMLIGYLDNFKGQNEFWYASRDNNDNDNEEDQNRKNQRKDDKWWLPAVKVPEKGLSEITRKWMKHQKELVNQVLKAAMAINAQVLTEMSVPDTYIESLPKNGRSSLGDAIYKSITVDVFNPEQFFSSIDLTSEHKVLDLKNRIEASIVIWKRKMNNMDGKSSWGLTVSLEKREQLEERAETILHILKQRFPGIPQSALDISKIQYNKDVGQAILESYSRVLESLAFTLVSRIDDVLYADSLAQKQANGDCQRISCSYSTKSERVSGTLKKLDVREEMEKLSAMERTTSTTLLDFIGWNVYEENSQEAEEEEEELEDMKLKCKPSRASFSKKVTYIEKLESFGGIRSPIARH